MDHSPSSLSQIPEPVVSSGTQMSSEDDEPQPETYPGNEGMTSRNVLQKLSVYIPIKYDIQMTILTVVVEGAMYTISRPNIHEFREDAIIWAKT